MEKTKQQTEKIIRYLDRPEKRVALIVETEVLDNGGEIYVVYDNAGLNSSDTPVVTEKIYTSTDEYDLADWLEKHIKEKAYTHIRMDNSTSHDVLGYTHDELIDEAVSELTLNVSQYALEYDPADNEEFEMMCKYLNVDMEVAISEETYLADAYEEKVKALLNKGKAFKDFDGTEVNVEFSPREHWAGDEHYGY